MSLPIGLELWSHTCQLKEKSDPLCLWFKNADSCWKELLAAREGGSVNHVWSEKISSVSLWETVYIADHKLLTTIFGSKRSVPTLAPAHLQRWSWFLSSYSYGIEFKSTSAHGNADCLSQLSLSTTSNASSAASIQQIKTLPVTDVELPDVMSFLPKFCATLSLVGQFLFLTHFLHQNELTLEDCALWGAWVIIPKKFQERVLEELHITHLGIAKTKALARSHDEVAEVKFYHWINGAFLCSLLG